MRHVGVVAFGVVLASCTLAAPYPDATPEICDNHVDDDLNARTDCDDPACNGAPSCSPQISWLATGRPSIAPTDTACPDRWRAVVGADGVTTCDPFPEMGPAPCQPGWAHFPGDAGCTPIGHACPMGDFPDDLPSSNVVFVLAHALNGDGSRARPYADIGSALMGGAREGVVMAVGPGTYDVRGVVFGDITIRGACAASTILVSSGAPGAPVSVPVVVVGDQGGATLRDLTIDGGPGTSPLLETIGSLTLGGVVLQSGAAQGIFAFPGASGASTLALDEVVIQHVHADSAGAGGYGIEVVNGGVAVRMHRVIVEDVVSAGVQVQEGGIGSLAMADVVVRDVASEPATGRRGMGVSSDVPTTIVATLVEHTTEEGLWLLGASVLSNVAVRDIAPSTAGADGFGVLAQGSTLTADHLSIERTHVAGIALRSIDRANLSDVVVRDTAAGAGQAGLGIGVGFSSSSVAIERLFVDGSAAYAAFATNGSSVTIADAWLGSAGRVGLAASHGAEIDLARAVVDADAQAGVLATGIGSTVMLEDVVVRSSGDALHGGEGIVAENAEAELERVLVTASAGVGIHVSGARARIVASDLVVRGVTSSACEGCTGVGALTAAGATLAVNRMLVDDAARCGLALDGTARLLAAGIVVDGTPSGACTTTPSAVSTSAFRYGGSGSAIEVGPISVPRDLVVPEVP